MATYSGTVANIRRLLKDRPIQAKLGAAQSDTTTETTTVTAGTAKFFKEGQVWEHADNNGDSASTSSEQRLITAVASTTVTGIRGYNSTTAATHSNSTYMLLDPRFPYDTVTQAIGTVLDTDMFPNDVYEIVEHEVTSSATSFAYNAPATACERILNIYQRIASTDRPTPITNWTQLQNADTDLWANGKVYTIEQNFGARGTAVYYVNCAHKLAVTTLSTAQERIVHLMACAYLLEWEEPKRAAGPTNQGDRTVRVGDQARLAAYYRDLAMDKMREEAAYLARLTPKFKRFVRNSL